MTGPRVLYLNANAPDYLSDAVLHGLVLVLGDRVVDVPRRDALYDDLSPDRKSQLYGRGFTMYGRLRDHEPDRSRWLERALAGEFDVIVLGDVWQNWGPWVQLRGLLPRLREHGTRIVALDGGDGPVLFPYGPTWWRHMRPWPVPRAHGRVTMLKREWSGHTAAVRYFGVVPPRLGDRLLARHVGPIAFAIPEDRLAAGDEPKTKLLATHVVDPEVAALWPEAQTSYAFADEDEYYADLRASRFGITTKKAGWETLRHYELAASGCVPCFRDLDRKHPRCAPHGLDETNCVPYRDPAALLDELQAMPDDRYAKLRAGALRWARANTTRQRALQVLAAAGVALGEHDPATADAASASR